MVSCHAATQSREKESSSAALLSLCGIFFWRLRIGHRKPNILDNPASHWRNFASLECGGAMMQPYTLLLHGREGSGALPASLVRALLDALDDGARGAVRLRLEGRSRAGGGVAPGW